MTAVHRTLVGPVVLGALAALLANDHLLKAAFPGSLATGKLSDVAGMVFFPVVLAHVLGGSGPRHVAWAAIATAVTFSAIKLSTGACELYAEALGAVQWLVQVPVWLARGAALPSPAAAAVARDPTDLVAVPFVLVPVAATLRAARAHGAGSAATVSPRSRG